MLKISAECKLPVICQKGAVHLGYLVFALVSVVTG